MSSGAPPRRASASAILEWALIAELPIEDELMAERIAAGAAAAAAAVRAIHEAVPLDGPPPYEPADYLATLERCAESAETTSVEGKSR